MLAHFVDSHQSYHGEWLWGPTSMILVILATCRGKLTPKVATWQQTWATWASSKRPKPPRYRKKQAVGPSGRRYSKRCCTQNFRISHHQREISVQKFRFETFDFQPVQKQLQKVDVTSLPGSYKLGELGLVIVLGPRVVGTVVIGFHVVFWSCFLKCWQLAAVFRQLDRSDQQLSNYQ